MLVDRHVKRLDVPHEPGEWLELKRLSFAELRELQAASERSYLEALGTLPEPVIDAQLRLEAERAKARQAAVVAAGEAGDEGAASPEPPRDPLAGKDVLTVLRFGVVGWSYTEADGETPVPVNGETVAALDETTALWAAREIMLLGEDDARLKGSSPSTATSPE